jgi:hypothetical protein
MALSWFVDWSAAPCPAQREGMTPGAARTHRSGWAPDLTDRTRRQFAAARMTSVMNADFAVV